MKIESAVLELFLAYRQKDGAILIIAPQGCECAQENEKLQLKNERQNYGRTFTKKIKN
jgi:hypothetical protein